MVRSAAGILYAAYLPEDVPAWGTWDRMDADDVELITNDEIVARVEASLAADGYQLGMDDGYSREEQIAWTAEYLKLPWRPGQLEEAR
jgi:hypothetical protein